MYSSELKEDADPSDGKHPFSSEKKFEIRCWFECDLIK